MNIYEEAIRTVFHALSKSAPEKFSPVLLCLSDLMVLIGRKGPDRAETIITKPDRVSVSRELSLDGHACISALTAGHLAMGLYADFETWLVTKVGSNGEKLLSEIEEEIKNYADGMFKCFRTNGEDRHIETPSNADEQVTREIDLHSNENQLSWFEFDTFGIESWLTERKYGLLVGDAESYLFTESFDQIRQLCEKAEVVIIDTSVFKKEQTRSIEIWNSVKNLTKLNPQTFISISDVDAKELAACLSDSIPPNLKTAISVLKDSLSDGYIALHSSKMNAIFAPGKNKSPIIVPTCNIKPLGGTNGAGDTFNGALALAALALKTQKSEKEFEDILIQHMLAFATATVSLRLEAGCFPTRAELFEKMDKFISKDVDKAILSEPSAGDYKALNTSNKTGQLSLNSAWSYCWDDIPKIFLVDLDHTLCDSKKWREQATMMAVKKMDLSWEPSQILEIY
ncbi:MAG: hypothetical protein WC836_12430, partial [Desulfobacula sp.]